MGIPIGAITRGVNYATEKAFEALQAKQQAKAEARSWLAGLADVRPNKAGAPKNPSLTAAAVALLSTMSCVPGAGTVRPSESVQELQKGIIVGTHLLKASEIFDPAGPLNQEATRTVTFKRINVPDPEHIENLHILIDTCAIPCRDGLVDRTNPANDVAIPIEALGYTLSDPGAVADRDVVSADAIDVMGEGAKPAVEFEQPIPVRATCPEDQADVTEATADVAVGEEVLDAADADVAVGEDVAAETSEAEEAASCSFYTPDGEVVVTKNALKIPIDYEAIYYDSDNEKYYVDLEVALKFGPAIMAAGNENQATLRFILKDLGN